ncbi:MAG: nitrous oxide reductase family maturation protein NosD [Azonexus sp.]|jgi:nitrous oxidase accessory protein|nr:nitrous oxide reductase family maturation protein NosD [Betaproteobacteria bacterium]MBK8918220.1 nitrous oxide reductase family maturation protein NosD [Betaproteobacteria bacterium]MBP6036230.1 nitrous oxide reductase family maturation protein NosD [Azonexus sp.]MBP6906753.1 nitrous oxide reductase family maturation protein NosD [Azonexus sp.]
MGRFPRAFLALLGFAVGLGAVGLATSQSLEGMGKPNLAANWGSSSEKARRPAAPHRTDIPWLQILVDQAPAGSVLKLPPGTYAGPVLVDKPLTLDGGGQVTVDGGGKGTVFVIDAEGVTLRNLRLTASGDSHDSDDTCLNVRGKHHLIEQVRIDDCLFGIDLKQADYNTIRENHIRSKAKELGVRGDGLRLWYSHHNLIEKNEVVDSRDMVAWYSNHNIYRGNIGKRSRYSIHFMFAKDSVVEGNSFYDNAVGIYLMYTERIHIRNNLISHATGAAGMALGFKESSDSDVENNEVIYCAVGVGSDLSPFEPDTTIRFKGNRFAFNGVAVRFTSELGGNVLHDNVFEGNLTDVVQMGRDVAGKNEWKGNYFADYQGFDRNGDGIGDTPYELYAYADQIWIETPPAQFFKTAPVLELLDFLERLAPFSSPELQLRDTAPRFVKPGRPS